jgi:hypothetical protein
MKTIDFSDVRDYYERQQPDGHWFDTGTKKFFGCRLPKVAYSTNEGVLFVSSELNFDGSRRYYTVRRQTVVGDITTVGEFQQYKTRAEAIAAIKELDRKAFQ